MAALPPFAYASMPLIVVSLWHLICSCKSYLRSPALFHAKTWQPCSRVRHGELYVELVAMVGATVYQAIALSSLQKGSTAQILALQQLAMLLFFMAALLLTLISEATLALPLPQDANFLLLGMAFWVEWFVIYRSSSDPQLALEHESFHILAAIAALSACACFLLAWRPHSFLVSITFSSSLSLQGTWLLQLGFSLYSELFLPDGCHRLSSKSTQCDVEAASLRAVALMDLAFVIHVLVVVFVFALVYAIVSRGVGYRRNGGYEGVDTNGDSEHLQMRPLSTKVVVD